MSKELMKVTATEAIALGETFFRSAMFTDIKSAQQAVVKIMAGAEIGIPPFMSMSGIHIIQGKPTIGAGLIASAVKGSGKYDYKVIEQTEKNCSIDFYQGKEKIGNSSFSIADAQKAGTKNIDKFPRNMLFARAISNGCRWFCPDTFAGPVYVPEEMTEDVNHVVEDATYWIDQLSSCLDINELKIVWGRIPIKERPSFASKKEEMKLIFKSRNEDLIHEANTKEYNDQP